MLLLHFLTGVVGPCPAGFLPPHFILFKQSGVILFHVLQDVVEHCLPVPSGAVGDFVFLQIELDQTVLFVAEHEDRLSDARFHLSLQLVFSCAHQKTSIQFSRRYRLVLIVSEPLSLC